MKKPATNTTGNTVNEANSTTARILRSSPASDEPLARAIPTGTAKKVRIAATLMTAVIAEQTRKYATGAPSGPSGGNSSKKRRGDKSTSRVVESRLVKGLSISNSLTAASVSRALLSIPSRNSRVLPPLVEPSWRKYTTRLGSQPEEHKTPLAERQGASLRPGSLLRRGFRLEAQRGGVYAVALASRGRSVVEQVPLVGAADGAMYFRAAHEEAAVLLDLNVILVDGRPEARPARAGVVLGVGCEEGRPAGHTAVDSLLLVIVVLTTEGPLGALHPRDAVLLGGELVLPFFFRLLYLPWRIGHVVILPRRPLAAVLRRSTLPNTALVSFLVVDGSECVRPEPYVRRCNRPSALLVRWHGS